MFKCYYCGLVYESKRERDACTEKHDLVNLQISRSDLNRLLMFIMTKEDKLISESLSHALFKYVQK